MGSKLIYETMDRTFRKIRKNDTPFGGVTMVFSGDWRQCKYLVNMILTYQIAINEFVIFEFYPFILQAYLYSKKLAELR